MTTRADIDPELMLLLDRLQAYNVQWQFSFVPTDDEAYEPGIDREVIDLRDPEANVISSELKGFPKDRNPETGAFDVPRHVVALDIDHRAYLVPSSTEGHSHLYIDVPGGIPHEKYMNLLEALADCGVIEKGYAQVSQARGHSDLRLPWVSKRDQKKLTLEEQAKVWEKRQAKVLEIVDPFADVGQEDEHGVRTDNFEPL